MIVFAVGSAFGFSFICPCPFRTGARVVHVCLIPAGPDVIRGDDGAENDVLAPCERPRGHTVVHGACLAVVSATICLIKVSIDTGGHNFAPTVFKKGVSIGNTGRSVV